MIAAVQAAAANANRNMACVRSVFMILVLAKLDGGKANIGRSANKGQLGPRQPPVGATVGQHGVRYCSASQARRINCCVKFASPGRWSEACFRSVEDLRSIS